MKSGDIKLRERSGALMNGNVHEKRVETFSYILHILLMTGIPMTYMTHGDVVS